MGTRGPYRTVSDPVPGYRQGWLRVHLGRASLSRKRAEIGATSPPRRVLVKDRSREGFGRRPIVDLCRRVEGRRPKASEEGTRGAGERFAVYGDLIGRRRGRGMRQPAWLRADWRWPSRVGRWRCTGQLDLGTVSGVGCEYAVAGRPGARCRERVASAKGWCNEVAASVMALRF
jgi:hypothetical protein